MTMIAGGDERVRNAFRTTLRDEPSSPNAFATQELDASDILEVHDLAHAIERAERIMATPLPLPASSRPAPAGDIFDALAAGTTPASRASATDDCAGPAVPAPRPTPMIPPPAHAAPVLPPVERAPVLFVPNEDDAFYQPAGRIRSLADVTLDGYRPEPTLMVRIRNRRRSLSWVVAGLVGALAVLAAVAIAMQPAPAAPTEVATTTIATATLPAATAVSPVPSPSTPSTSAADAIPVLDVKNLPSASPARAR